MTATAERRQVQSPPALPASVWSALARKEARFVLRHPLTLLGVAASCYLLWSFNQDILLPHLAANSTYVGLGLAPLAAAGLLVGHLVASRAQRHDTVEIEDTAPAVQRSRTLGRLAGSLVTMPVAACVVVLYMVYLFVQGATGKPVLAELLVAPLVVGIATASGVAIGTWFPNRFSGLIALAGVAGVQIALQDAEGTRHWFAWWHTVLWHGGPDLWVRPSWAHVAYLVGALLAVSALALLRHGARPLPLMSVGIGLALVVGGGMVQSRPPEEATVEDVLARIAAPEQQWTTIELESATYRVYPTYERLVEFWDDVVARVVAPLSADARPALVMEQTHHPYHSQLQEEYGWSSAEGLQVQRRGDVIAAERAQRGPVDPAAIEVGTTIYKGHDIRLIVAVASRAVGLPLAPVEMKGRPYTDEEIASFHRSSEDLAAEGVTDANTGPWWPGKELGEPAPVAGDRIALQVACIAEGQAREVLAAWLAATASPDLAAHYAAIRARGPRQGSSSTDGPTAELDFGDGNAFSAVNWAGLGWEQGSGYSDVRPRWAVVATPTATDLAAQLLTLPQDEVAEAVAANWTTWIDPATGVDAIVEHFGLEPAPTPEEWLRRAGLDPADFPESVAAYPFLPGERDALGQANPICP